MLDIFPYILLFLLLWIGVMGEIFSVKSVQLTLLRGFVLLFLVVFLGLRFNTGADWFSYTTAFEQMPKQGNYLGWEIGYVWLSNLFYYIFGNYYFLQFFSTYFLFFAVWRVYKKYSNYPMFSLSIFVLLFVLSLLTAQVRQSWAVAILLLGTPYIFDGKFVRFFLVVLCASFFHVSAILALPLYFLNRKVSWTITIPLILLSQVFFFFPDLTSKIIEFLIPYLPERLGKIAEGYLKDSIFSGKASFNTGMYYITTLVIYMYVLLFLYKKNNGQRCFFINSLVVAVMIKSISLSFPVLERFMVYYFVFGVLAFSYVLDLKIQNIKQQIVRAGMALLLFVFFLAPCLKMLLSTETNKLTKRANNYGWVPYYNVISYPEEALYRKDWNQE